MNLGSLFISLGVKGSEKAIGSLGAVRDGLNAIVPKSLEAKAGIIGAMYALEQFFSHGADRATTLENMSATLGVSVEKLQLLGNAALESRTPLETVVSTLQNAQLALAKLNTEGQTQPWMNRFIQLSGAFKLGPNPFMYLQQHIEELPKFIQAYADTEKDIGTRNLVLQSLGMSGLTAAVARGNFRPENMAKAGNLPTTTADETKRLDAVRTQLAKINQQIEVGLSKIAAKFGPKMIGDVEGVVTQVMKLVGAFATLSEKIQLLEGVGKVFEGWSDIFEGLTVLVDAFSDPKKMDALKANAADFFGFIGHQIKDALPGGDAVGGFLRSVAGLVLGPASTPAATGASAVPTRLPQPQAGGSTSNQNVNVNQNFHFDDTKDRKGVADAAGQGVKNAYRQNPALLRHN